MKARRLAALLVVVATAVVVAGCGGGDTGSSAVAGQPIGFQELSRSATSSAKASSGRFSFDMSLSFPGAEEPFAFSGEGAFDTASERASFTIDMSSFASLFGGLFSGMAGPNAANAPDFDDPELWKIEAVQDGAVSYVRFPALDEQLPSGKSWIRADERASIDGFELGQFEQFTTNDPRMVLESLRAISGDVETVGTEELRGTVTTHYRATLDLRDYEKLAPAAKRDELGALVEQMTGQAGVGEIPVDVWLDEHGLVRKLALVFTVTQPGTSESSEASLTFELWDYGEDVAIEPPPASDVVDASALHS